MNVRRVVDYAGFTLVCVLLLIASVSAGMPWVWPFACIAFRLVQRRLRS